jgi:subtilisin family serine protease
MPTDPNTEAAFGRARIARHKVQGGAAQKFFVTQGSGNNSIEVPLSAVSVRRIRLWWWLSSFSYSNLKSRSFHIVAWSFFAVAIGVLAVTTGRANNPGIYQTASATTKIVVNNGQPPPQQEIAQKAANQRTTIVAASAPVVKAQAPTQPPVPPRQPPPSNGQVPRFGSATPFVKTKFFIVPPPGETRFVANELVLQIGSHISRQTVETVTARLGLTLLDIQHLKALGTTTIRVSTNDISVPKAIRLLARQQIIGAATANYIYSLTQDLAARSSEDVRGDAGQYVLDKLHLTDIHRMLNGTDVLIGVIDSEIDGSHPDLEGVISGRFDATGFERKPHPHGTGMAGAIASQRRLLGIAPGARLLAIRAFIDKPSKIESTTFDILKSLDYAIDSGVRIVNMSFAGPRDPTLERAFKVAHDKGVVLIAAAGNAGPNSRPLYPAADESVIAVTATDVDDKVFAGANRGPHIAISAPGVDILVPALGSTYQMSTGTSVATAHISGVVALLLQRNSKLAPDDIRKILSASAKLLGPKNVFGAGLVDAVKALKLAEPKTEGEAWKPALTLGLAAAPSPTN